MWRKKYATLPSVFIVLSEGVFSNRVCIFFNTGGLMNMITAPNFTQMPNVIFDYWMAKLSHTQYKVLSCLCRKIFGWHKIADAISLKQIQKMTGLTKPTITKSLKELEVLDLVIKTKNKTSFGDDDTNQYTINVHSIEDGGSKGNLPPSKNPLPGVVKDFNQGVVKDFYTQKKDSTKERHTKEKSASAHDGAKAPNVNSSSDQSNLDETCIAHVNCKHCGCENWYGKKDLKSKVLQSALNVEVEALPSSKLDAINLPEGCETNKQNQILAKQKKKVKDKNFSQEVVDLSDKMIESLKQADDRYIPPVNLQKFYTAVDLMLRVDKRDSKQILEVFKWSIVHDFWSDKFFKGTPSEYLRKNFLSLLKQSEKKTTEQKEEDRRARVRENEKAWKECVKGAMAIGNKLNVKVLTEIDYIVIGNDKIYFEDEKFKKLVGNALMKTGISK